MNPRRPTRSLAWLLAAALLLAQALGLAHRIGHAPGAAAAAAWADHDAGSAECRLVDQLAQADALFAPPQQAAALPPGVETAQRQALPALTAAAPAAYLARAPPRG